MKITKLLKEPFLFANELIEKRFLIYELIKRDYKSRHMGSMLGMVWAVAQPIIMMLIMWFVFSFGLKVGKFNENVPFVVYMFTAQIAWVYFSDAWNSSTGVIMEYSFLVKKINFRLGILPVVKMGSALINHAVLMLFLFIVLIVNGFYPSFYWFQWFYYLFCIMALALGLSWMTSAVNVFWRDTGYIISIALQFGFWLTPIFYRVDALPESFRWILRLNPMYYIVEGYRNTFIYHKGFWTDDWYLVAQYWGLTIAALLVGMMIFKRLRPHFADVI